MNQENINTYGINYALVELIIIKSSVIKFLLSLLFKRIVQNSQYFYSIYF